MVQPLANGDHVLVEGPIAIVPRPIVVIALAKDTTESQLFYWLPGRNITYCWYGYVPPIWVGFWLLNFLNKGIIFIKFPI